MRQLIDHSREELYFIKNMDVLQIVLVVFMPGTLGAVIVGAIAMAINGKLIKIIVINLYAFVYYFRLLQLLCL